MWYFEPDGTHFKMYTVANGQKVYLHQKQENTVELQQNLCDLIDISLAAANNAFYFKKSDENRWLQHSGSGKGMRYWKANDNAGNSQLYLLFAGQDEANQNTSYLDGKSYGLMNFTSGTVGNALMADESNNRLELLSLVVRADTQRNTLFVAEDSDISLWTFHLTQSDQYTLSTVVNGETKYLKIGDTLTLTDKAHASAVNVSTSNGRIRLSDHNRCVTYTDSGFTAAYEENGQVNQWLYLTEQSGLSQTDYVTYSAEKASVSDVPDGSSVIVYTRVWNDTLKSYEFYAIDHDGALYPCYERGDNIMWVGHQINTMLWNLIEYHYDDGSPNYYYELYNPYSHKFFAPQIKGGQILSGTKIGINLPGRRDNQYYTDILAWDDAYYTFAGVKSDIQHHRITAGYGADTYYFAKVDAPVKTLTRVNTIDNTEYGITMKMIDYTDPSLQNSLLGDKDNTRGLLSTDLKANGYPNATKTKRSFSELFAGATTVNHLFVESIYNASGYFEFDSCQNFATLINESGKRSSNFTVYKELGTTDREPKTTLKHGQFFPYDTITAGVYSTKNPENLYSASAMPGKENVGLLPENDPRKYEKLHSVGTAPNYYNGMEIDARFVQTPSGKDSWGHDIIFEFKGDDDFWLYVDDELVIDLGGIHSALAGTVNFATGFIDVDGTRTNLRDLFASNYKQRHTNATTAEVNAFLADYFAPGEQIFKDYSSHTMKIFYMERGAGASNLHMRFNLSYITPGHVMLTKKVVGSDDVDFNLVEYPYQIWYKDENEGATHLLQNDDENISVTYQNSTQVVNYMDSYTPPNSTSSYRSVYFLNPGKSAEIHFPANTIEYKIIECGVNTEVYESVTINGDAAGTDPSDTSVRRQFESGWIRVSERPTVVFENRVNPDALRTLSIQKRLYDETGTNPLSHEQDATTFSFRLYLSNGSDDTLRLANMYKYYVRDPDGFICKWDADAQCFDSTDVTEISHLPAEDRNSAIFETSMNGAISKIPAWYTVAIPSLPVGTKFRVVERDYEIPAGYKLVGYQRDGSTYIVDNASGENTGWVRANESPKMYISNQRGWEIQADKIWSDTDYVSSHAPIYTAVYVSGKLVDGSIRQLSTSDTSVRYFFDTLAAGKDIGDYEVREVEVVNPTVVNGTVTAYKSVHPLSDGDRTSITAVSKTSGTSSAHDYNVDYKQGTVSKTAADISGAGNTRIDTITNTRWDGIIITLYDMKTREPLCGGTFALKQGDTTLGTFTSDAQGRITIMYDCKRGETYTLVQISPPDGYIGLPYPTVFSVSEAQTVAVSGNEYRWASGRSGSLPVTLVAAYIDIFNKPFTLLARKIGSRTGQPVAGAHFALYRSVQGIGGQVKDYAPMAGFADLVSSDDGIIPGIDNTLPPGTYYLTETAAPTDYQGLSDDIVFTLSPLGVVTIQSKGHSGFLNASDAQEENAYVINSDR